jgi:hypothetical protein
MAHLPEMLIIPALDTTSYLSHSTPAKDKDLSQFSIHKKFSNGTYSGQFS